MSKPSYHILITAIEAYGHINAICGFGELLARHGHKVTFAHRLKHKKLADQHGFDFIAFDEQIVGPLFEEVFFEWMDKNMDKFRREPMERFKNYTEEEKKEAAFGVEQYRKVNEALTQILAENSFDAIVHDGFDILDCLYKATIPVVSSFSAVPLILYEKGPPGMSGFSVTSDPKLWEEYNKYCTDAYEEMTKNFNALLRESGRAEVFLPTRWILPLKTVGFYHYPADLDYTEFEPIEPGWHRIDCYVRSPDEGSTFELPDKLKDKPGKLIYFSLGSTASNDLLIMNKCLSVLARCGHRVIVSMGRRGDKLNLSDNMWGQEYVNQVAVIEKVDLVITHGGNNTFMETLYHGKPMIVIPWFFDQLDNAQRVVDKQIGYRVNPWEFDEDYFLNCIEKVLNDQQLQESVKKISENMRNSNSGTKAVKIIEDLIVENKKL
ncbi:NDP-glycosyltransferase YjiC-like isoform X1 [Panonychus citri]|uniref:NDP-glycosyltransferase YjiC-like isoform X1 n=1 Tax=Panonychus citri TaxID=50023 RepID=UPI002307100C|nr:NDP-glycosyltransferase YjiC-like isoform X1 [Panonychus citri]